MVKPLVEVNAGCTMEDYVAMLMKHGLVFRTDHHLFFEDIPFNTTDLRGDECLESLSKLLSKDIKAWGVKNLFLKSFLEGATFLGSNHNKYNS